MMPKKFSTTSGNQNSPEVKVSKQESDHSENKNNTLQELNVPDSVHTSSSTPTNFDLTNQSAFFVDISNRSPQEIDNFVDNSMINSNTCDTPSNFNLTNESAQYIDISSLSPRSLNNDSFEHHLEPKTLDFSNATCTSTLPFESNLWTWPATFLQRT